MRNGHGKHPPGKSSTYPRRERAFGRPQKGRIRKDTANAVFLTNTLAKRKVDVHNSSPQQRTFASLTKTPWGGSSAGRALRSQCRGREFDPPPLHHIRSPAGFSFFRFQKVPGLVERLRSSKIPGLRGTSPVSPRTAPAPARSQVRPSGRFSFCVFRKLFGFRIGEKRDRAENPRVSSGLLPRYA